jgi:aminotransferase
MTTMLPTSSHDIPGFDSAANRSAELPSRANPAAHSRLAARVSAVPPSGIRQFFDVVASMPDVISLGIGEPDFTTPRPVLEAGIASLRDGHTHYTSNYGILELRRALASHIERLHQVSYDPTTEILVTVGASEAVAVALTALVDPGDEVLLHEPSYVAFVPSIVFNGGIPVLVPTSFEDSFELDPDRLEAAITPRTKLLFLSYPCNPTGAVLSAEALRRLAEIVVRHDLLVITDEIYHRLIYGGHLHETIAALPGMKERTVLIGGFSKTYAMTGWRIGYICAPPDVLEGMLKVHQYWIMSAPTMAQEAAIVAIHEAEPDVARMVAEYDRRRRLLVEGLNRIGLPTFDPLGAFYAFPKISVTGLTSEEFCERLLHEERVAMVPGGAFGPSGQGHARACYATSAAQIEEALRRIDRFVQRLG